MSTSHRPAFRHGTKYCEGVGVYVDIDHGWASARPPIYRACITSIDVNGTWAGLAATPLGRDPAKRVRLLGFHLGDF